MSTPGPATTSTALDASTVINRSNVTLRRVKSLRVTANITQGGQTLRMTMRGSVSPENQIVSFDLGPKGKVEVLSVAENAFMVKDFLKGDEKYWIGIGASPNEAKSVAGRYVELSATRDAVFDKTTIRDFVNEASNPDPSDPDSINPETTTVSRTTRNGVPALRLDDSSSGQVYFVTDDDDKRLLYATHPTQGEMEFSEWNAVPTFSAPPKSELVTPPEGVQIEL